MKTRAFIALGSNLDDPLKRIDAAFLALSELPATQLSKRSPSYRNRAVGPGRQPDFINAVAKLATDLDPHVLLDAIQDIERAQGRERDAERWAPRIIDLDILLYGDCEMDNGRLTLPHPEMHRRRFVLQPLSDIAPDLEIPGHGSLRDLLRRAPAHELIRIASTEAAVVSK
ncbi:MAG TPA: 2-amino-4-hydroxy-6-hydroxymethyldihydropteridine diphosphokinase [Gammaproteobacteria bacterium]|nr:2-amino-4-hydroxy-6-hydroxymethyldihydropteridine diphosphokinase [Gammaproteobacteria bacterium]